MLLLCRPKIGVRGSGAVLVVAPALRTGDDAVGEDALAVDAEGGAVDRPRVAGRQDVVGRDFHRVLGPLLGRFRTQVLEGGQHGVVVAAPLAGGRVARALTLGLGAAEGRAAREPHALAALRTVHGRRIGGLGGGEVGAAAEVRHLGAVGARIEARIDGAQQQAERAGLGIPLVAVERRIGRRPALDEVAVAGLGRQREQTLLAVERQAGAQVDRARDAALDHVGRRALEHVDAAHQFGRHVREAQGAAVVGREGVAAVQFRTHEVQAADHDAAAFAREVVRIDAGGEAVDRHARNALQRLGHRAVRQGADILGGDRVADDLGALLELLRALQALTDAGDHHLVDRRRVFGRFGLGQGRRGDQHRAERQGRYAVLEF
jgi:hypothetical protein